MITNQDYKTFGKIIIEKLRDESFANYKMHIEHAQSMTLEEYNSISKNPNIDKELQKNIDNSFKFLNSLNDFQKEQLDKLILKILDENAFTFLRDIEEGLIDNNSIGITYKGKNIETIYKQFLSGTFFGEYFLWAENYSSYGKVQS